MASLHLCMCMCAPICFCVYGFLCIYVCACSVMCHFCLCVFIIYFVFMLIFFRSIFLTVKINSIISPLFVVVGGTHYTTMHLAMILRPFVFYSFHHQLIWPFVGIHKCMHTCMSTYSLFVYVCVELLYLLFIAFIPILILLTISC